MKLLISLLKYNCNIGTLFYYEENNQVTWTIGILKNLLTLLKQESQTGNRHFNLNNVD